MRPAADTLRLLAAGAGRLAIDTVTGAAIALTVIALLLVALVPPAPAQPPAAGDLELKAAVAELVDVLLTPPAARPDLALLTVPELRTVARQELGPAARIQGRRIAQARKADLLAALTVEVA